MNRRAIMITKSITVVDGQGYLTPAGSFESLTGLLNRLTRLFDGEGVVLLSPDAAQALALPTAPAELDAYALPDLGSWKAKRLSDWTTFTHDHNATIILGIMPLIKTAECPFLTAPWPTDVTMAFKGWHDLTGRAWHRTAGVAGVSVLRSTLPTGKQSPTFKPAPIDGATENPYFMDDFLGERADVEVMYDKTRAYIGAAGTVRLAPYSLRPGPKRFEPDRAGWWRVKLGPWNDTRLPNPAGYGDETRWVTSPTLALLEELRESGSPFVDYEVIESRVSTGPGRELLKPWANKMRDAYDGAALLADPFDQQRVRQAVKDAGRAGLGMLAAPASWLYRPDWWAAIVAQHRSNMFRTMLRTGTADDRWPVQVNVDAIWYPRKSEDLSLDKPSTMQLGDKLGCWKLKKTRMRKGAAA